MCCGIMDKETAHVMLEGIQARLKAIDAPPRPPDPYDTVFTACRKSSTSRCV
jgi:hypothetical protein